MAYPNLKRGSKGIYVEAVQKYLGIAVDGSYGQKTEQAVRAFQGRKRLTVDGKWGPQCWSASGIKVGGSSSSGGSSSGGAVGGSAGAIQTVVKDPLQMVIGGALLYGLFKVFMRIF